MTDLGICEFCDQPVWDDGGEEVDDQRVFHTKCATDRYFEALESFNQVGWKQ